jgi:hypothetical protein
VHVDEARGPDQRAVQCFVFGTLGDIERIL